MTFSRRQMIKLSAAAATTWVAGARPVRATALEAATLKATAKIPVGLELWSVRHQCEQELPAVLKAIARMGYDSVEIAHSFYGHDALTWRKLLDKNGLKSCGMHMGLQMLEGDAFEKTVADHKIIGTPYLIIASLPKKRLASVPAITETAKQFNQLAERLEPHGMKIGYHCHGGDFDKVGDLTAWEIFGEKTKDDVLLQLDIGNCLDGGGDPIAMLKKFPGRSVSLHLKDYGGKAGFVFGEGQVNWKEVLPLCETIGGTKQYIIEEEGRKGPEAIKAVRQALVNYRKMTK
jgi:sugar phosphate isomerase/epimerase